MKNNPTQTTSTLQADTGTAQKEISFLMPYPINISVFSSASLGTT